MIYNSTYINFETKCYYLLYFYPSVFKLYRDSATVASMELVKLKQIVLS